MRARVSVADSIVSQKERSMANAALKSFGKADEVRQFPRDD